jgi:hypothetical protein
MHQPGEMMTAADNQSLPDTQPAAATTSDRSARVAFEKKWVRLAICCAGAIICIPVLVAVGLGVWVLVKYFLLK